MLEQLLWKHHLNNHPKRYTIAVCALEVAQVPNGTKWKDVTEHQWETIDRFLEVVSKVLRPYYTNLFAGMVIG